VTTGGLGAGTVPASPVAVVVASRDRPDFLAACLAALREALRPGDEAVVVDSCSRSGATAEVAAAAGFHVLRCDRPGASRARNLGWRATTAPVVAFTDDDCLVEAGWTAALAAAFSSDPAVGFVTGAALPDRTTGPTVSTEAGAAPVEFTATTDPRRLGHGANMAFRRPALAAIGGFDERLGAGVTLAGCEDKDAFWRVLRAGWSGRYEPTAVVTHRQWRGRGQVAAANLRYGRGAGALAAKVIRLAGRPGWRMLRHQVWDDGVAGGLRAGRHGYGQGVVDSWARVPGVLLGAAWGAVIPLDGTRFRTR
jgi:GT2 family glycosyltransferase